MNQTISEAREGETFQPSGDIVSGSVAELRQELRNRLSAGIQLLTLDLSGVRMVDSAGIGLLISAHNSLRKGGGTMELIHVSPELRDLFRTMRMHQHFRISGGV